MSTAFDWMPWLTSALGYAEWIVAGVLLLLAIAAALGLAPIGLKGWALAAVFLIAGLLFGGLELHNARTASNAFAAFQAEAKRQIDAKQAEADAASTKADQATTAALVAQGNTVTVYQDRILHDAPSACPPSAADRDAARGVRELYQGAVTLGAQAGQKAGAGLPGAAAGAKP